MIERGNRKEAHHSETILSEPFAHIILHEAKAYLRKYPELPPALFALLDNREHVHLPLMLPETHQEKRAYFDLLGSSLSNSGKGLLEAIMIAESWYVEQPTQPSVRPSQHPNRKEAITLVGRNASGSESIFALQPFARDARQKPIFEPLQLKTVSGDFPAAFYLVGLLDYLFTGNQRIQH